MTNQNEFQSLDELFKNTFDNLPDTPAASGWDQPSPRVWESLDTMLQPKTGFQWQYGAALAGTALVIIAGLYFYNRAQQQAHPPSPTEQVEQKVADQPAAKPSELALTEENSRQTGRNIRPENTPAAEPPRSNAPISDRLEPIGFAEQLPGTKPVPPNTTEQLKEELKYIWTFPVSPLPAPSIPSSVRRQVQYYD
jgi:hypothetical protein